MDEDELEVIGYDEDDDEEIGVRAGRAFRGRRLRIPYSALMRAARVRKPVRTLSHARTVGRKIVTSSERRRYLPLDTVAFAAGPSTAQLQVVAQGPIQGERLIITTDAAAGEVTVTNIRIGVKSQLEGTAAMPIEAFAADATGSALRLDPVQTGQQVTIDLASTAVGIVNASGVLIGVTGN